MGVTLDAGPLVAADRNDRTFFIWWKLMTRRGVVLAVPATVIAQVWRSPGQTRMAQVLSGCYQVPLDPALARSAGQLCGRTRTADVVDASVVAIAAARADDILTSDPDDFKRLASLVQGVGRILDFTALRV